MFHFPTLQTSPCIVTCAMCSAERNQYCVLCTSLLYTSTVRYWGGRGGGGGPTLDPGIQEGETGGSDGARGPRRRGGARASCGLVGAPPPLARRPPRPPPSSPSPSPAHWSRHRRHAPACCCSLRRGRSGTSPRCAGLRWISSASAWPAALWTGPRPGARRLRYRTFSG